MQDPTGLVYLGARYYEPELGRFLSLDPVLGSLSSPQTTNRYVYCANNPELYTDPSGAIIDIAFDVASIAWDIWEIFNDPSEENVGWLVVDVVCAAVPFLPAVGGVVKVGKWVGKAIDAERTVDKVIDGARAVERAEDFSDFFRLMDEAPNAGRNADNGFLKILPDDAYVVRGGINTPELLAMAEKRGAISANSAPGMTVRELAQGLKHNQIGFTKVGEIRAIGGDVISSPLETNPFHATIVRGSATHEELSRVFVRQFNPWRG
jgi:RHS repeat-associated protein